MNNGPAFFLSGRRADAAAEALDRLSAELLEQVATATDPSLANGLAGVALANAYLARLFPRREHHRRAVEHLERCVEAAESLEDVSLFTGALGVGFVLEHLCNEGILEENDASTEALSESLVAAPSLLTGVLSHDELVRGASGILVYAAECRGRHRSEDLAHLALARLRSSAESTPEGAFRWYQTPFSAGIVDVGVAHGQAGIVGALACAARAFPSAGITSFARGAFAGLSRMRIAEAGHYPSFLSSIDGRYTDASNAWCYGNAGTTAVALLAASGMGLPTEADRAVARSTAAVSREAAHVRGIGLCHGTASLAHVLRRLSALTGDSCLRDASERWFDELLDELRQRDPRTGSTGLLEGTAGAALVVAGALDPCADSWDAPLLLSTTPGDPPTLHDPEGLAHR